MNLQRCCAGDMEGIRLGSWCKPAHIRIPEVHAKIRNPRNECHSHCRGAIKCRCHLDPRLGRLEFAFAASLAAVVTLPRASSL
jgi:hypothetical protein